MYTAAFWAGAFDRVIKSFAQALLLMWGADEGFSLVEINFAQSLGVAAGAAVLSLLTSLISAPVADRGSTSLLPGGQ